MVFTKVRDSDCVKWTERDEYRYCGMLHGIRSTVPDREECTCEADAPTALVVGRPAKALSSDPWLMRLLTAPTAGLLPEEAYKAFKRGVPPKGMEMLAFPWAQTDTVVCADVQCDVLGGIAVKARRSACG